MRVSELSVVSPPLGPPQWRPVFAGTVALALVLAAGVFLWIGRHTDSPEVADARRRLLAMADTIITAPSDATNGPYTHVESMLWVNDRLVAFSQHEHIWYAADGSGRWVHRNRPYQSTSIDLAALATDFADPIRTSRAGWGPQRAHHDPLDDLPAAPRTADLLTQIGKRRDGTGQTLPQATALAVFSLHSGLPSRAVRVAALRALAAAHAFTYAGRTADAAGREGESFQIAETDGPSALGHTYRLVFDARTGELLAFHRDDAFGDEYTLFIRRERTKTNRVPGGEQPCPAVNPDTTEDTSCRYLAAGESG